MKKLLLLIVIAILYKGVNSQGFNTNIAGVSDGIKYLNIDICEINSEYIIVTSEIPNQNETQVLVLGKYGNTIKEIILPYNVKNICSLSSTSFAFIGHQVLDSINGNLVITTMDEGLDNEKISSTPILNLFEGIADIVRFEDKLYYYSVRYNDQNNYSTIVGGEIDLNGNILSNKVISIPYPKVSHMQTLPNGDIFFVQNKLRYYIFDSDFNYKYYQLDSEYNMYNHYDSHWVNENTLLFSGSYTFDTLTNLKVKLMDPQFNVIEEKKFDSQFEDNFTGIYSNLITYDNNFYVAGTKGVVVSEFPIYDTISEIFVSKLDYDLNTIWQKEIGGDAYYLVYSVAPTQNGGCLILSSRYSKVEHQNENDLYLIRMDPNGDYVTIDLDLNQESIIEVYPNPGCDFFKMNINDGNKNSWLKIYNHSGQLMCSQKINSAEIVINTTQFERGLYIYHLYSNTDVLDSGIWIKD